MILVADARQIAKRKKRSNRMTTEAAKEMGKFAEYVNENIPALIAFGVHVLLHCFLFYRSKSH